MLLCRFPLLLVMAWQALRHGGERRVALLLEPRQPPWAAAAERAELWLCDARTEVERVVPRHAVVIRRRLNASGKLTAVLPPDSLHLRRSVYHRPAADWHFQDKTIHLAAQELANT